MRQYEGDTDKLIQQVNDNRLTNPKVVLEAARTLRDIAKGSQDHCLLGFADYNMACAYFVLNDADSEFHYADRAIKNLLEVQEWNFAGNTYNIMALMHLRLGNMAQALELFSRAMRIAEEHQLYLLGALSYLNGADVCTQLEHYEEALKDLLIAESLLDKAPVDEKKEYYGTIASAEAANAAMILDQMDEYKKQRVRLDALLEKHPEYRKDVNVLLLEYRETALNKDLTAEEKLVEEIKTELFSSPEFLNYANETMSFLEILKKMDRQDILNEVLTFIDQSLNDHESIGIMTRVSSFKVSYYLETGKSDLLDQELMTYWNLSSQERFKNNNAMIKLIETQNSLQASKKNTVRLKEIADTDSLTSLPNRRAMNEKLDQLFEQAYHQQRYLGIEMLDVDYFKQVNDSYGHSTGDDVLVLLGKCLKEISSESTFVARYGGDEFVIAFTNQTDDEIRSINQLLNEKVKAGIHNSSLPEFTLSQGIFANIPHDDAKVWDYTSAADAALYFAKNAGRNQMLLIHSPQDLKENATPFLSTRPDKESE